MVRTNTILAALCVLVLGGACTSPTPEEPARQAPKATRRALGEGPAALVDVGVKAERALVRYPEFPTAAGTTLLFAANEDSTGPELWRLDARGPALVADIVPGITGSAPSQLFHSRGLTWFTAADEAHGVELWRTDGTTPGTFLLKDILPGSGSSRPTELAELNGWIFFSANDGTYGAEPWRTDGTPEGTQLVRDISLGAGGSEPQSFTELGGRLYFLVKDPGGARQLWRTDGTAAGTVRVGTGVTVTAPTSGRGLVRSGRALYFAGNEGTAGAELWKTDGTEAGTVRVKDILPGATGSSPVQLTAFEGAVYFVATDGVSGRELWKTDGTEAGTQRVLELISGNNSVEKPDSLVAASSRLFFMLRDSGNTQSALYATDGTAAGTAKLVDFKAAGGKGPLLMTAQGSTLYFTGYEPGVGHELWTSDGTPAGSRRIGTNVFSGDRLADPAPEAFTVLGDTVYFVATAPGTGYSDENPPLPTLWKSKGDVATTVPVGGDLTPTRGSNPAPFAAWDGALYFTTFEQEEAARLWRTDGTVAGTVPLVNIVPEDAPEFTAESGLSALTPLNGALYFAAMPSLAEGFQLWKTNGTAAGTARVTSAVRLTTAAGTPMELVAHNGFLFFAGQDSANGIELWKSDGTAAGTTLVKDIAPGSGPSSRPSRFTPMGDALYFIARNATGGRELWKTTDGTAANTSLAADVRDFLDMSAVMNIAGVVGSTLYFVANEANTGIELWKTDGTPANTSLVKDIAPGILDAGPSAFAVIDGILYFTASDGFGPELWRTDGTESGTVMVKELSSTGTGSNPGALTVLGKTLYFTADDGTSGRELWKLDTTASEPVRVKDIFPGPGSGVLAESFFAIPTDGLILFAANDGVSGTELWRSDGTEAGTFVLHDIAPWQLGSHPAGFTRFADTIAFSANDGRRGREPWLMPVSLLTNGKPPDVTCPTVLPIEAQQFLGARVDFEEATASDDTGLPPALSYSRVPGSLFPLGDTVVHVTARDTAGLVATCSFTVTVVDTTPPEPVCPADATVEATTSGGAIITYAAPQATDLVTRTPVLTVSQASGTLFPQGNTTVTVTATDARKNSKQCTFTVRVQDTTAAVVSCPADQIVEAESSTGAHVTWPLAEASDGEISRPTLTYSHVNGDRFPLGNTPVTATAKDGANNTSSCTFQVTVRDTQAPSLRCPPTQRTEALGPSGAPVEFTVNNVVDTVSTTVDLSFNHASGDTFPVGATPVQVQARDASGNVAECVFSVEVVDTLPPLLTCPQDVNIAKGPVAVQLPQPSSTDRVTASPAITFSPASGSVFKVGTTPVEVTAQDGAGNSARCTFNVHIEKSSGCSAAPGSMGAAGWMGLVSLLALATRRRSTR
ncbi:ELWxxDGT repeat protein [Archangium gephyra]|uniref:ELWxxDGT repeat protein n=1 Tax=Archangium gephyra TaxID=48 RepID=A0AAC8QCZ5_9BACT|nr:ELWxxDGT repeat protein [Archangium gephyra]AKJ04958.1 Flagellar hook-length control protein FliK [Archangium gephyra]REG35664.1 ELWxxDGT repeat protein [Archangium gephyra]